MLLRQLQRKKNTTMAKTCVEKWRKQNHLNQWEAQLPCCSGLPIKEISYVFTKIRQISIFPNLSEQINGLGSFLHVKSQIKFSLSIHTTQQVVAKRLESLPGVSQLWHLKWALHTDATSAPLANSPPFLTLETFNTMTRRNICKL